MTKKSMHNQKQGISPVERKRLADLKDNPLKCLHTSYTRSKNALDAWEAITVIHKQLESSTPDSLEYPRWVQDYLSEVALRLLNADKDDGASASFLARTLGVAGKRQALKRVADRNDFEMFLEVISEQDRLPSGKKEEAYGKVGGHWGKLDADTVRKKCTKVRRGIIKGFTQE